MIVSLGALRPEGWAQFAVGTAAAVAVATVLDIIVPRLYPWGGEEMPPALRGTAATARTSGPE